MKKKENKKFFEWTWLLPFFFLAIVIGGVMTGKQQFNKEEMKQFHNACKHWAAHPANYHMCLLDKQKDSLKQERHYSNDLLNADNEK